jgi:lipoprotein Spr
MCTFAAMKKVSWLPGIVGMLMAVAIVHSCRTPEASRTKKSSKNTRTESITDSSSVFYTRMSHALNIPLQGNENPQLLRVVESWVGVPYKYGGQDRKGTDCSGLVNAIYLEVYKTTLGRSSIDIMNSSVRVKKEHLREGDFVFFAIGGRKVNHVGIYINQGYFVHSTSSKGVMINNLSEQYYEKHFTGGGRLLN